MYGFVFQFGYRSEDGLSDTGPSNTFNPDHLNGGLTKTKAFGGAQSIPGHLGMHFSPNHPSTHPFFNINGGDGKVLKGTFHPEDFNKKMASPSSSVSSTNSFQANLGNTFHPEIRNDIDKIKDGASDEPVCQLYRGTRCTKFLGNKTVYIPAGLTQKILEDKLNTAFTVIEHSQ